MKPLTYIRVWLRDTWRIFKSELSGVVHDGGVMIIFLVGGLCYPLLYNVIYYNGVLEDTPVAVVDMAGCKESRRYLQKVDATRELRVAYRCMNMLEAEQLMRERKVNGILYFPSDFGEKLARMETATLSVYADMSSFLYYKNLLMGVNYVMLDELGEIQVERYAASGLGVQEANQQVKPVLYEENMPYNRTMSYTLFFLSAALLLVLQQTMFYGMSIRVGTMREENRSFASLPDRLAGRGVGRVVLGRGAVYALIYLAIGLFVVYLVPAMFGFPQRGNYFDLLTLLLFYLLACVFFCTAWSSLITRRETVFSMLLFISPVALFLTGFSWPECAFPVFWKYFAYLFPSTFGCRAFIDLNSAGADLTAIRPELIGLTVQAVVYYAVSCIAVHVENWLLHRRGAAAAA